MSTFNKSSCNGNKLLRMGIVYGKGLVIITKIKNIS
eukprot:gene4315-5401_t